MSLLSVCVQPCRVNSVAVLLDGPSFGADFAFPISLDETDGLGRFGLLICIRVAGWAAFKPLADQLERLVTENPGTAIGPRPLAPSLAA